MIILEDYQFKITQKMVNDAQHQHTAYNFSSRVNADALMFENMLIWSKMVEKPLNWRHDFIYRDMKIDAKELSSVYFNIQPGKTAQYRESIASGDLTHFLFYNTDRSHKRTLKAGDVLKVKPIALCPAREVLKASCPSRYTTTEAYVTIEIIKNLGVSLEKVT